MHEGTTVPDTLTFVPIKEDTPPIEVVFLWNRQADVHELVSAARHLARSG
ncbi:hypothetical protein WBK31_26930 [Nonomuraea sp. N2-4H]